MACVYALFAGMFIYKDLKLTNLPGVFMRAAKSCSFIVIISFSTAFAKLLTLEGVTSSIANGVLDMTTNKYLILILINVLLLVVGMIMDAAPATIILSPILLKIVQPLGVDPIQLGVIIVMNLSIGMITPPVGINLFVGCKISKIQLESTEIRIAATGIHAGGAGLDHVYSGHKPFPSADAYIIKCDAPDVGGETCGLNS